MRNAVNIAETEAKVRSFAKRGARAKVGSQPRKALA